MKRRGVIICIIVICLAAAALLAANLFPTARPAFNGSRVRGEAQYLLDFTALNGTETHTLTLKEGDTLQCVWQIGQGTVDIMIGGPEGGKLFQGNHIDQASFTLTAVQGDDYTITVTGQNARGSIDIRRAGTSGEE